MTRTCEELMDWAYTVPRQPLLAITLDEARQFGWNTPVRAGYGPNTLCGMPCIVIDLPPNHFLANNGEVYPL